MALTEYDDLLAGQSREANEYDAILQSERQQQTVALKQSIRQAVTVAPDQGAEAQRLADQFQVPADVVRRNFDRFKQRAVTELPDYDRIIQANPHLTEWLSTPENAAVAHDDLEHLGFLEWVVKAIPRAEAQTLNGQQYGALRTASLFRELTPAEHDQMESARYNSTLGGELGAADSWFRGALTRGTKLLTMLASTMPVYGMAGAAGGAIVGGAGGTLLVPGGGTIAGAVAGAKLGFEAGSLYGLGKIAFQTEAGASYDQYLGMRDEFGQPMDPGVAKMAALATAAINAGLMVGAGKVVTDAVGSSLGKLTGVGARDAVAVALKQPSIRAALANVAKTYGASLTEGTALMVGMRAVSILGGELAKAAGQTAPVPGQLQHGTVNLFNQPKVTNPDGSVSTVDSVSVNLDGKEVLLPTVTPDGRHFTGTLEERTAQAVAEYQKTGQHLGMFETPEAATAFAQQLHQDYAAGKYEPPPSVGSQLLGAASEGLQSFALVAGMGPALGLLHDVRRARQAEQGKAFFTVLGEGIAQSKTVERLPQAAQAFLAHATKDGPVETVYAPVDTFTTYWQSKGVDPSQMAEQLTGKPDAYQSAIDTGTDLPIPTASYAVNLAGTEHHAYFADELRLGDPQAMNGREAAKFQEDLKAQQAALSQAAADRQDTPVTDVSETAQQRVRQQVVDQLVAGGKINPRDAEKVAALVEAGFNQMATDAGVPIEDVYRQYGLTVERPAQAAPGDAAYAAYSAQHDAELSPVDTTAVPVQTGSADALHPTAGTGERLSGRPQEPLEAAGLGDVPAGRPAGGVEQSALDRVPESARARFTELHADARGQGYTGSDHSLADRYTTLVDKAHEIAADLHRTQEEGNWRALLTEISKSGGISLEHDPASIGEWQPLVDTLATGDSIIKKSGRTRFARQGQRVVSSGAGIEGAPGVFKRKGGLSFDGMREAVAQNPNFRKYADEDLKVFMRDLEDAVLAAKLDRESGSTAGAGGDVTGVLERFLEVREGGDWWKGAEPSDSSDQGGDASFNVDEFFQGLFDAPHPNEDLLPTGEAQPRLPGDVGDVRTQEVPTPTIEAPFSLTPEVSTAKPGTQASLFQPKRGSLKIGPDGKLTISLFKLANRSTPLHEFAHVFLEVFGDLADKVKALDPGSHTEGQTRLLANYTALLQELKVDARAGIGTPQHEHFADGFLAYLREGKAPSTELRSVFASFRAWLLRLGHALLGVHVQLTPELRQVYDRILASDSAIAEAQAVGPTPLFTTAESMGKTPAEFELYRKTIEDARRSATEEIDRKLQAEVAREQTIQWQEQRAAMAETVTKELRQQPVYRAISAITKGTHPDGSPITEGQAPEPLTLSRALIEERYGKDRATRLPKGLTVAKGGFDPETVAEFLGYSSGDALLRAIEQAPDLKTAIDQETSRRMLAEHGSLLRDGTLPEKARIALSNTDHEKVVQAEMRALGALQRTVAPFVRAEQGKAAAALKERAYERRWLEAEAKLRIAIAEGHKQVEIDALTSEVQALKAKARGGAATIRAAIPPAAVLEANAKQRIGSLVLRELNPQVYWSAARRASQQATERAARQDLDGAMTAKQQELINLAHFREAERAKDAVQAALVAFKKLNRPDTTIAKTRNLDLVHAARAVLASVGLGTQTAEKIDAYLGSLQTYDPEAHTQILDLVQAATPDRPVTDYRDLSVRAFQTMAEAVTSLWTLARTTEQITINGERVQLADARRQILDKVREFRQPRAQAGYTRAVSGWDRVKVGGLGFRARMRRIEDWVTVVDNGREGIARRAIYDPINAGAVRYDTDRAAVAARYAEIAKGLDTDTRATKIEAPELGYTFTSKHQDLLGALLHTGNGYAPGSNGDKLLRGRGWGQVGADGLVDTQPWRTFLDRMQREGVLTRADYDFVQAVWDLNASLKAGAQATHKARFGRYFDEVTSVGFDTPFGSYEGGYYPAIADPFITPTAGVRQDVQALLDSGGIGSTMFPSVGRGFTQTRTEAYAKPLIMDASQVLTHINAVLKFTHLSQPVHEVARLVLHPAFREAMNAIDPAAVSDLLQPYLQRAASQTMFTRMQGQAGRATDAIAREIRNRGAMQIIALNGTVLAEQFTHFPSVLAHADVDAGAIFSGLWRLSREPRALMAEIHEASPYMATRESAGVVEARQTIDRILLDPNPAQRGAAWVADHANVLMRGIQSGMDAVTWHAVYSKVAAESGMTHAKAVLRADSAVRQSLGSYRPQDRSAIEGGSQMVSLLNQFYGFFNTKLNMLGTEAMLTSRMGLKRQFSRGFAVYALGFMVPAILGEGIKNAAKGQPITGAAEGDDDAIEAFVRFWGMSQLKMGARMIPFGGAAVEVGAEAFAAGKGRNLLNAPSVTMVENAIKAPGEAYRALTDTNARTPAQNAKAITDFFTLLGLLTNLPMRPVGQAVNALHDYLGKANPQ